LSTAQNASTNGSNSLNGLGSTNSSWMQFTQNVFGAVGALGGGIAGYYFGAPVGLGLQGAAIGAAVGGYALYTLTGVIWGGAVGLFSLGVNNILSGHASLNDVTSPTVADLQTDVQNLDSEGRSIVGSVDDPTLTSFAGASESYSQSFFGDQGTTGFEEYASDNFGAINDYVDSSPTVITPTAPWDDPSDSGWMDT